METDRGWGGVAYNVDFAQLWDALTFDFVEVEPGRHRPPKALRKERKAAYLAARREYGAKAVKHMSMSRFCRCCVAVDMRLGVDMICVPWPKETDTTATLSE